MIGVIHFKYYQEFTPYWPVLILGLTGQLCWIFLCFKNLSKPRISWPSGSNYPYVSALFPALAVLTSNSIAFNQIEFFEDARLPQAASMISVLIMFITDFISVNKSTDQDDFKDYPSGEA